MNNDAKSLKECLAEAAECDRLASLARSEAARRVMTLCATAWRRRAEEAAGAFGPTDKWARKCRCFERRPQAYSARKARTRARAAKMTPGGCETTEGLRSPRGVPQLTDGAHELRS